MASYNRYIGYGYGAYSTTATAGNTTGTVSYTTTTAGFAGTVSSTTAGNTTHPYLSSFLFYPSPETEEQKAARLEAQRVFDLEQERLRKELKQAESKAEALLKEHIGLEAFGRLHQVGYIEVDSQKYAGRKYRVPKEKRNLIEVLDGEGRVIDRLCVHPTEAYPIGDEVLARIVMLKFAEEEILKIANHTNRNPVVV